MPDIDFARATDKLTALLNRKRQQEWHVGQMQEYLDHAERLLGDYDREYRALHEKLLDFGYLAEPLDGSGDG